MLASCSEAQCLGCFLAGTSSAASALKATRERTGPPGSVSFAFREVAAAGITTSWVSGVFNFTDVAKVRMQASSVQATASSVLPYGDFKSTVARIVTEEGLSGLFLPGIVASLLRDLSYSGLSIGMYPSVKQRLFGQSNDKDVGIMKKFASGMMTGALFSGFVNPADLVKIRVQAEAGKTGPSGVLLTGLQAGHQQQHANSLHAFLNMRKKEGLPGLYRGCSATMVRAALGRGAQLSCYDHSKYLLKRHCGMHEGVLLHSIASFLSGLAFATASAPADIVKTRLMADTGGQYRGPLDCFCTLIRVDGPSALLRGWTPSAMRLAPHFTLVGVLMEQVRNLIGVGFFAA